MLQSIRSLYIYNVIHFTDTNKLMYISSLFIWIVHFIYLQFEVLYSSLIYIITEFETNKEISILFDSWSYFKKSVLGFLLMLYMCRVMQCPLWALLLLSCDLDVASASALFQIFSQFNFSVYLFFTKCKMANSDIGLVFGLNVSELWIRLKELDLASRRSTFSHKMTPQRTSFFIVYLYHTQCSFYKK